MRTSAVRAFDRGAHAPPRAGFGAVAETLSPASFLGKVRDRERAITSTRGACALQKIPESW